MFEVQKISSYITLKSHTPAATRIILVVQQSTLCCGISAIPRSISLITRYIGPVSSAAKVLDVLQRLAIQRHLGDSYHIKGGRL